MFDFFKPFSQNLADHWFDANEDNIVIPVNKERKIIPEKYRTLALDMDALKSNLADAPMEFTMAAKQNPKSVVLPMPNGEDAIFHIFESPVMSPELAAKYPEIKTYAGYGAENKLLRVRFEFAAKGFRAMIASPEGQIFIDPYLEGNNLNYLSYYKKDRLPNDDEKAMLEGAHYHHDPLESITALKPLESGGPNSPFENKPTTTTPSPETNTTAGNPVDLRVYRLAVATSGEFQRHREELQQELWLN